MALEVVETARGAMTGARYIESLRDGREVWLDGEKVADVTKHPATTGMVHELARIYDLQHSDKYRDEMTFVSPETGNRCSLSWLLPRSHEDLKRQRRNSEIWNEESWGQLGRSPDILAPFITGLVAISDALEQVKHPRCNFAENVVNYHRYCMENDLFLTHALGDPQVDRSAQPQNETRAESETEVALHVVEETNEGVIVHGAKQLATAAPISNETYVSLSATFMRRSDPRFILSFSIPTETPGIKMLCREPVSQWAGSYGHPLGAAYDEQDAMLFFDHVLVPWDRIFMLYDSTPLLQRLGSEANFRGWGNLCRIHQRMKMMTAVATLIAEAIGVIEYREVSAKLGEMAMHTEMWRHAMDGVEHNAYFVPNGARGGQRADVPGLNVRHEHLLRPDLPAHGRVAAGDLRLRHDHAAQRGRPGQPRVPALPGPVHAGQGVGVEYKSRLFRLAHDLAASSFGMRQEIYEYWHGGDPNRNRINLLRNYDQTDITERIKALVAEPLRS